MRVTDHPALASFERHQRFRPELVVGAEMVVTDPVESGDRREVQRYGAAAVASG